MTKNENFNMVVKKFILNNFLYIFTIVGYIGGGVVSMISLLGYWCGTILTLQPFYISFFFVFLAALSNCLWYCLREYDKKYGLFNGWEDGCDVCKQLVRVRNYDSGKEYDITIKTHLDEKKYIFAKGYLLYCPHCGRKLSSFNTPRYW